MEEYSSDEQLNQSVVKKKNKKNVAKQSIADKIELNRQHGKLGLNCSENAISNMRRRYELAYRKLFNELPAWKQKSFASNQHSANDTLHNEFIKTVIALAEDTKQEILLTTQ